jgi:Helix-turn-helix domain
MTIGETLAKARRSAGLTITQVSERTRVRETIIRGIEEDDYSACGGDFYARGHIRSIARVVGADPIPLIAEYDATVRAPEEITAANWTAILAVAALAAFGFLGYHLASSGGRATASPAAVTRPAHHAARHGRAAAHHAHPKPTASPATAQLTSLTPVRVTAFGPNGAGQGDNPGQASLAVSGNPATPWNTDWYATADFGNMQSGTGLLLDMGKPVTVTSVEITLGSTPGADLQLRTGNAPQLADLRTVATATNAGGVVHLQLAAPAQGQYLLIWFTKLPPDSSGTFEAFVSGVSLKGQA